MQHHRINSILSDRWLYFEIDARLPKLTPILADEVQYSTTQAPRLIGLPDTKIA